MTARTTTPPITPPAIAPVLLFLGLLEGEVVVLVDEAGVDVVAIPANTVSPQSLCSTFPLQLLTIWEMCNLKQRL